MSFVSAGIRTAILGALLLAGMRPGIVVAQDSRDDWQHLRSLADLAAHLNHSLADAPLTAEDRAQIYDVIDDKFIHDRFRDDQREEERRAVLSARVGSVVLAEDGSQQILVRGPEISCGAAGGNCPIRIFVRQRGKLRPVLETEGNRLIAKNSFHQGFRDIVSSSHMSAFEVRIEVYRWNGTEYEQSDAYDAKIDPDHPENPPAAKDRPAAPHQ